MTKEETLDYVRLKARELLIMQERLRDLTSEEFVRSSDPQLDVIRKELSDSFERVDRVAVKLSAYCANRLEWLAKV